MTVPPGPLHAGRPWLQAALLFLLAVAVYANAVDHPFLYDDLPLVVENPKIRSLERIQTLTVEPIQATLLRPRWTRFATYALEFAVAGTWAPLYHGTNVLLHGTIGLLVFLLVSRASGNRTLGWWSAALFLLHPINTEVVAHVAGRRGLLAALFSLVALLLLQGFTRRGGAWRAAAAAFALYLAAFSKEHAILTPVAFVLLDLWGGVRSAEPGRPLLQTLGDLARRRWALYSALTLATLGMALWFMAGKVTIHTGMYETSGGGLGWVDRAGIAGLALRMLVAPIGQSVDYSFDALGVASGARPLLLLDLSILLAGVACALAAVLRRSWIGFGGLWMLLYFSPHLGFVSWHEVFAERFLYLPSIGFGVAVAAAGQKLACREGWRRPVAAAALLLLALFGTATVIRNQVWASSEALWSDAVRRYPECARARKALGDVRLDAQRPDLALEQYREAIRLADGYVDAHVGLALAHTARGDFGQAMRSVESTLQRWPSVPRAWNLKGYLHETFGEEQQALDAYRTSTELSSCFAEGYNNLARSHATRGEVARAVELYEKAIDCNPGLVVAWRNLATIHRRAFSDERRAAFYDREATRLEGVR